MFVLIVVVLLISVKEASFTSFLLCISKSEYLALDESSELALHHLKFSKFLEEVLERM